MDDKTHQQVAPAALFKDSNPLDPTGAGDYYVNCSNPLLSAQQRGILCTPAQVAADTANPGSIDRPDEDRPPQRRGRQSLHRFRAYELPRGLRHQGNLRGCLEL